MIMTTPDRRTLDFVFPRIYVSLPPGVPADVKLSEEDSPVECPLAADLIVLYAYDLDTYFAMVSQGDLADLGVSVEELHARSVQNLRALNLEVQAHSGERCKMLTAGGNFEAALVLLPELWDSIETMVDGAVVISVPARDVVYFTGDAEKENLAELRTWTSKLLELADKPLSRAFLCRKNGAWVEYTGFAG